MLDQNALTPLYEQLKNAIKEDIKAQIYRPGDRMPSEAEMEEKYQVSRITVRKAVKELCDEEILVRRQGKGTFVLNNGVYSRIDRLAGFHDSLGEQGKKVEVKVLEKSIGKPKPSYARDLQMAPQDDIVYLKRIMYADDIPVMIDTCYIPMKRFPGSKAYGAETAFLFIFIYRTDRKDPGRIRWERDLFPIAVSFITGTAKYEYPFIGSQVSCLTDHGSLAIQSSLLVRQFIRIKSKIPE